MSDIISFSPVRALDINGNPVSGAQAFFFRSGTTTPATVYQDVAEDTPHARPVVANAAGVFPPIYRSGQALRVVVNAPDGSSLPGFPLDPVITVPAEGGAAGAVSFNPTSDIPVTNVQAAIERVQSNLVAPLLAGGIGVTGNAPVLSDVDATDTASGFYRWTDSATGTFPDGWSGETGTIWLFRENVNNAVQFIARRDINALFTRRLSGGTWLDWVRYDAQGAIDALPLSEAQVTDPDSEVFGTVSGQRLAQAGTIVESDINANGSFVKFSDGTMICRQKNIGGSNVGNGSNREDTVTFPAEFVERPEIFVSSTADGGGSASVRAFRYGAFNITTTEATVSTVNATGTTRSWSFDYLATGFWK